jgi:putative RNA 2'-phosphotransferase
MNPRLVRASKFLSLVLRHQPQEYDLAVDQHGWAVIDDVISAADRAGIVLTHPLLQEIVSDNDKQRFAISEDGRSIRARQGHSIPIDLGLMALEPPALLYHGTAQRFLSSIRTQGLISRSRQYVHLSLDIQTALIVGQRHGDPVVLTVRSDTMYRDGHPFYRSENGIWLVDSVPIEYLIFPDP